MRTFIAWLAVLGLVVGASGCVWRADDSDVVCDPDGHWPRCSDQGEVIDCPHGDLSINYCADDSVCMAWQSDGQPQAACVQPDAAPCDPETFEPVCAAADAVWQCAAPGYTYREICEQGQSCSVTPVRAACTFPGDITCDPNEQDPFCDGDAIAYCDADRGIIIQTRDCAPEVCRVGARGPVCADPGTVACDPEDFDEQCVQLAEGEAVVDCHPFDELTRIDACEPDERCRSHGDQARCFGPDQADCDPDTFEDTCSEDDKLVCNQFGVEEVIECALGEPCRLGGTGPRCVPPDAVACDPADFSPTCDGGDKIYCSASSGFTYTVACEAGLICVPDADPWSWTGLACVDPAGPTCDIPGTFTCAGTQVVFCSGGYEIVQDCQPAMVCVADAEFWLCLPADATDCDPDMFEDGCADNTAQICFGQPGKVVEWACTDPLVCTQTAEGPECQQP